MAEKDQAYQTIPAESRKLFEEIRDQFPGEELGKDKWEILTVSARIQSDMLRRGGGNKSLQLLSFTITSCCIISFWHACYVLTILHR
jgi:hypothetical protein